MNDLPSECALTGLLNSCESIRLVSSSFHTYQARWEDRADLIKNGEVALGRVLRREGPRITCEFTDAQGRRVQSIGKNLARNVQEGMHIPVFYDPQNPADHVGLCGSWYEIASPGAGKRVRDP